MATTVIARVVGAQLREPKGSAARYRALAASAGQAQSAGNSSLRDMAVSRWTLPAIK